MKKHNKIVLAGGTGQIGKALSQYYKDHAAQVIILSRAQARVNGNIRYLQWDGKTTGPWINELAGTDMLINLAGKNVNCRYTEKNKKEIFDSRTDSIQVLAAALAQTGSVPALWVQFASATIYRHAEDRPMTEDNGEYGTGFSVDVCKKWESTFMEQATAFKNMRKAVLRTSMVLSESEGVLPRLKKLCYSGLGGRQGNGKQWVSWIHEKDVVNIVEWLWDHKEQNGTFNCTAPLPVTNTELMQTIRKALHVPAGLPAPAWLLRLGAMLIGTETELVLKSRWVLPDRLQQAGFRFQYPAISQTIAHLATP